jgi:hypothetical protein
MQLKARQSDCSAAYNLHFGVNLSGLIADPQPKAHRMRFIAFCGSRLNRQSRLSQTHDLTAAASRRSSGRPQTPIAAIPRPLQ